MKKFLLIIIMMMPFLVMAQDLTPKVIQDSTGKKHFMFTIPQAKEIAKKIKQGEIDSNKAKTLQQKIDHMDKEIAVSDSLIDSLYTNNKRLEEISNNQEKIIVNKDKIIAEKDEIIAKQDKTVGKLEKKVKRRNGVIKALVGTNVGTGLLLLLILL